MPTEYISLTVWYNLRTNHQEDVKRNAAPREGQGGRTRGLEAAHCPCVKERAADQELGPDWPQGT